MLSILGLFLVLLLFAQALNFLKGFFLPENIVSSHRSRCNTILPYKSVDLSTVVPAYTQQLLTFLDVCQSFHRLS